jgi:hypothetical protein
MTKKHAAQEEEDIRCSFCRGSRLSAGFLVEGHGASICRGCAELCLTVFRQEEQHRATQPVDLDDSVAQVKGLLGLLPGVELTWAQKSPAILRLGLAIREPRSLAILAHVAAAANVPLHVEVARECPGRHDDPDCVRYDLRVPIETAPYEPPSNLQLMGGMLALKLKGSGLLDADNADSLLRAWNFGVEK